MLDYNLFDSLSDNPGALTDEGRALGSAVKHLAGLCVDGRGTASTRVSNIN